MLTFKTRTQSWLPPRYERNSIPEHPRTGMPEVSRPEGELADRLDYWDWDWGKGSQPKAGDGD